MDRETQVQSSVSGANGGVVRSDPEVVAVAKRRQFSMTYKRRIVHAAALCKQAGEIGALLRRGSWPRAKGLYSSHLTQWRKELQAREAGALAPKRRRPMLGWVTFFRFTILVSALMLWAARNVVVAAPSVSTLDLATVDRFINIQMGNHSIPGLAMPGLPPILHTTISGGSVPQGYLRRMSPWYSLSIAARQVNAIR